MHETNAKALVTPSYDVMRWGTILDTYDCPRLGYDITILVHVVTWEKMGLRRSYDDHRHVDNRMELQCSMTSYDRHKTSL